MSCFSSRRSIPTVVAFTTLCGLALGQQDLPRPIVLYRPPAAAPVRPKVIFAPRPMPVTYGNSVSRGNPGSYGNTGRPVDATNGVYPGSVQAPQNATPVSLAAQGQTSNPGSTGNSLDSGLRGSGGVTGNDAGMTNAGVMNAGATNAASSPGMNQAGSNGSQTDPNSAVPAFSMAPYLGLQNPAGAYNISQTGITASQQYAPNLYFGQQYQTWSGLQQPANSPAVFGEMSRFQPGPSWGYTAPNTYFGAGFSTWNNLSSGSISANANGGWNYSNP